MITKDQFIANLNNDLASELGAVIQYTIFAAQVNGPIRPQLVQFFQAEVPDEQRHALFLANKIVTLGGIPTTVAAPIQNVSGNKAMLEAVLAAENMAVKSYTQRAQEAADLGYKALALDLEDMIRDETNHAEETKRILTDWPV